MGELIFRSFSESHFGELSASGEVGMGRLGITSTKQCISISGVETDRNVISVSGFVMVEKGSSVAHTERLSGTMYETSLSEDWSCVISSALWCQ